MFRPPITKLPIQAYIQIIYVRNMKYKKYPIWQTTLTHNKSQTKQQLKVKSKGREMQTQR